MAMGTGHSCPSAASPRTATRSRRRWDSTRCGNAAIRTDLTLPQSRSAARDADRFRRRCRRVGLRNRSDDAPTDIPCSRIRLDAVPAARARPPARQGREQLARWAAASLRRRFADEEAGSGRRALRLARVRLRRCARFSRAVAEQAVGRARAEREALPTSMRDRRRVLAAQNRRRYATPAESGSRARSCRCSAA